MSIVAKAVLLDVHDRILVLRRSSTHPKYAYHLDFPGGMVETNETPLAAVVREILEETGLVVPANITKLAYQKELPGKPLHLVFMARLQDAPEVVISWEHDEFEWLPASELLARPIPSGVDNYYETALEYIAADLNETSEYDSSFLYHGFLTGILRTLELG